ncbi:protein argonaute-2 isoform X2 [Camponotus floridanus]|uniref:protein argonaute-2 isoform X2 n=1 Tax=Camponotus floridanus TaxID=104421 RepID=UPI000DC6BD62|nr:protein argonaute-2 isoform X2 [Camponotus floridanus]
MGKGKGKKKKQSTQKEEAASTTRDTSSEQLQEGSASKEETASTSKAASSEQLQVRLPSQKKEQVAQRLPQKQQVPPGPPQQSQFQPELQGAWGKPQQAPPAQQQQGAQGQPRQAPPSQSRQAPPAQQQEAWGQPQQAPQFQPRQAPPFQPQQAPPFQPRQAPPAQQQGAWGQPRQAPPAQQQGAWGQPRQAPPAQQQGAWGQPRQAPSAQQQGAWGQPQQAPPAQQQGAWGQPQQVPPAQQQGAWGQPQQAPPPQQQQGAWGQPRQAQQQQQRAWGEPQQSRAPPQQQQSEARQQVPIITGAGDAKLITDKSKMHSDVDKQQQATTSVESEFSQISLRDPLQSTKTSQKAKMTSSAMKQYQLAIPKRKNIMKAGTKGIPIRVYTNLFEIIFGKDFVTNAVHYDVTISPIASKAIYRKVFEKCRVSKFHSRYPAFDGKKNAYSANDLPFGDFMKAEMEIYIDEESQRRKTYTISLKKVANIDLSWIKHLRPGLDEADRDQTGIQALDIIMRHAPESRSLSVGKSLFWEINDKEPLSGGLSLSRGGFMSAVLGWQPYINIDVSHKGFPKSQNVVDLMAEFTAVRGRIPTIPDPEEVNKRWNREKIEKFLKGLKVTYEIPNGRSGTNHSTKRTYRLNGLGPKASMHKFNSAKEDEPENIQTIVEYFAERKHYNLRHPDLPCLWAGAMDRREKIYLPAELCTIVAGQSVNRKLDEMQTSKMIKYAATDAPTRKRRIEAAFTKIDVNTSSTMNQEFHLSISTNMKEVDARILPAPVLQYKATTARVSKGIWQMQAFQTACNLEEKSWTILDLTDFRGLDTLIRDFINSLQQCATEVGMTIGNPQVPWKSLRPQAHAEITEYFRSKKGSKLIIVIIPDRTDTTYGKVKQITELSLGILTQCIKLRTIQQRSYSAVKNILLKINSKLNGINHTLTTQSIPECLKKKDCMLVGADVTHPSPDAINIPSIAAVAASSNDSAFQYNIALRLQQPKEEMILDLEEIIISQLNIYRQKMSYLPKKIIYYRDGVSEGQLAQVMHFEINAIKRACTRSKAGNIQITCLVVQKRHHVRLFPTSDRETDDRNKNVRAGTIVDTEITHPNHIDFYLVSHASIQGTARPTKYRCICNESDYTEDNIEELTYYLCHMYARCTRAVSYPAPTYYAHLGAYRGRALIQGVNIRLDNLDAEQNKLCMRMDNSPMCFV